MSAKPKQSSRWGSLLQGAVAGIESRLDTILADSEDTAKAGQAAGESPKPSASVPANASGQLNAAEQNISRSSSRSRADGRLQDRLAKALGNAEAKKASSLTTSEAPSRTVSPALSQDIRNNGQTTRSAGSPEPVLLHSETNPSNDESGATLQEVRERNEELGAPGASSAGEALSLPPDAQEPSSSRPSHDSIQLRPSIDDSSTTLSERIGSPDPDAAYVHFPQDDEMEKLRRAHAEELKQRQVEMHEHLERIDALQAKLQYLAKAAIESAREASSQSAPGSIDKKLAEKDEQLALLMEEGQKLSKNELKHMNTIKKLRAKNVEEEKTVTEVKQKLGKTEKALAEAVEKARRGEAAEKQAAENERKFAHIERDIETLQAERETSSQTISELRRQLDMASRQAEEAERKLERDARGTETKLIADLRDELSDARIEKKLAEDRARAELRDAKQEAVRQQEKAKVVESELRAELANLESKVEIFRARTEEVSSSATGDSQAKLLRQIETLQTQYALANENWQGIEGTLTARVAALEKERDEGAQRESAVRKKARELSLKLRRLEEDLESANDRLHSQEQDLAEQRAQINKLQAQLSDSERALDDANTNLKRSKAVWEAELQQRLDEEKSKWRPEPSPQFADSSLLNAESPTTSYRKQSASDILGPSNRRKINRVASTDMSVWTIDRPPSQRPTPYSLRTPDSGTPQRQDSTVSLSQLNGMSHNAAARPHSPSLRAIEPDDAMDNTSSPRRTVADMVSVSTVGAGPSVQLVERMSAAVRRLESEKAASKEEQARLVAQRDEARKEVVALMGEVESKRQAEAKVNQLEEELKKMDQRYQTTLEMLGEKSERVDELTNDVADLKQIYRELVESKTR